MRKTILLLFFAGLTNFIIAQEASNDKIISAFLRHGRVLQLNSFVKGDNEFNHVIKNFTDASLRYEIQTNGCREWHSAYNYPSYGFGLYLTDFDDKGLLNTPFAAYAFLSSSYWQSKRLNLRGELALGLAANWNHFSLDNALNVAVGSPVTCYLDYGLHLYYKTDINLDFGFGLSMTHYSNGALRKPNRGINVVAPRLSVKYKGLNKAKITQAESPLAISSNSLPALKPRSFVVSAFGGIFGYYYRAYGSGIADSIFREQFLVGGLSVSALHNFNIKHSLGFGLDVGYFEMTGKSTKIKDGVIIVNDQAGFWERLNAALFLAYEYRIRRFAMTFEPSIYLYKYKIDARDPISDVPLIFQRIGIRWQFFDHCFVGLKLRAYNISVAHFLEWSVGIKL